MGKHAISFEDENYKWEKSKQNPVALWLKQPRQAFFNTQEFKE